MRKCLLSTDVSPTELRDKEPMVCVVNGELSDVLTRAWEGVTYRSMGNFKAPTSPESHLPWIKSSFKQWKRPFPLPFHPPHIPARLRPHTAGVLSNTREGVQDGVARLLSDGSVTRHTLLTIGKSQQATLY